MPFDQGDQVGTAKMVASDWAPSPTWTLLPSLAVKERLDGKALCSSVCPGWSVLGVGIHSYPREIRSLVHSVHLPKVSLSWSSEDR